VIQVDDRAGSAQLAPLLRQRGYPTELGRLNFGDVAFTGVGVDGVPVGVGLELKSIHDVLQCIQSSRYAGYQLPGMVSSYDVTWLLIVGIFRPRARDGVLEYQMQRGKGEGYWKDASHGRRRSMLWHDLQQWLFTMIHKANVKVAIVDDYVQAALFVGALYGWWSRGWDDHASHLAMHDAMRDQLFDRALLQRPTLTRCIAAQLPSVGKTRSAAVAARFKSVQSMVEASEKDWAEIEGIGKQTAHKVWIALRGGSNGNGGH
jgi:hypothetical protein